MTILEVYTWFAALLGLILATIALGIWWVHRD